jgi:predicted dehydrogenase
VCPPEHRIAPTDIDSTRPARTLEHFGGKSANPSIAVYVRSYLRVDASATLGRGPSPKVGHTESPDSRRMVMYPTLMLSGMDPIRFAIIGSGWRTEFYVRVARALPEMFEVTGVQTRDAERAAVITHDWAVPGYLTTSELLSADPAFVVVSVPWAVTPTLLRELSERGVPVLTETPPAPDVDGLRALKPLADAGARIQVAEQYQFQPLHAARLTLTASNRLGTVSEAQLSVAHGYHGIDLMRRFLDLDEDAPAIIRGMRFGSPLVAGPDRDGPPTADTTSESLQTIAWFDFGDRLGVMDFADEQYFSWVRSLRLMVRGDRGEIDGHTVRYVEEVTIPMTLELVRHDTGQAGNLEGHHLSGITCGAEWLYRNPFLPARLSDDEIAVATTLARMYQWLDGGPPICSLAHGAQDHYLTLLMDEAAESGQPVRVPGHIWAA